MSFDKNNESPAQVINPRKKTTKVNFVVVIAVLVFFGAGALIFWSVKHYPPKSPAPTQLDR